MSSNQKLTKPSWSQKTEFFHWCFFP